jgi:PAS domain S-box-containing protein
MAEKVQQTGRKPVTMDDRVRICVIIALIAACILITGLSFELNTDLVATQIFYLPILYATCFYPKRGIIVAGICGFAYEITGFFYRYPDAVALTAVTVQATVFIGIAGIVMYLIDRIRAGETQYRTVFEHSQLGIVVLDQRDFSVSVCNQKFAGMLNFKPEELRGRNFSDLFYTTTEREKFFSSAEPGRDIEDFETRLTTHEGSASWVNLSWTWVGNNLVSCTAVSINARKFAEKAADDNITKYHQLTEHSPEGILIVQDGAIRFANPAFGRFLGYPVADILGKDLCAFVDEKNRAACTMIVQSEKGEPATVREGEFWFRTHSGDVRVAGFSTVPIQHVNRPAILITMIDTTEQQRLEEKIKRDNDRRRGIIMTVAHELRTPLQPIMGYLNLLVQDPAGYGINDETKKILGRCIASVDRERQIINQMLDLAVLESGKLQLSWSQFSLATLVRSVIDASGYATKAEIRTNIPGGLAITADIDRLFVVIDSLLSNAVNYSTPPRLITIAYASDQPDAFHHISIADNGVGIPDYALNSIFEPFQLADAEKLSRQYGRIGISLSIARKIMQLHGGDITVRSSVGAGSTFTIYLPREKSPVMEDHGR